MYYKGNQKGCQEKEGELALDIGGSLQLINKKTNPPLYSPPQNLKKSPFFSTI
jgi:hypothetical protein